MIEPRCPQCISPEIEPDPESTTGRWRCGNCGQRFDFEHALIRLGEAEDFRSEMEPDPMFHLHRNRAQIELRACDGSLRVLGPFSDAEELNQILEVAASLRVIEVRRRGAALHAYLFPGDEPHPVLGIDPGVGPELVGPELALAPEDGEDPISYTVRWLGRMVDTANDLLTGGLHGAAGARAVLRHRADGPRSHRPTAPLPQPGFVGDARLHRPDGTIADQVEAEGATISEVLAALGDRIEAGDIDPAADVLVEAAVTRPDGDDDGESAR
jgi:hypothetical protein